MNFATEIKDTLMAHLREAMVSTESIDIRQVFAPAMQAVTELVKSKMLLCAGQDSSALLPK